MRTHAGTHRKIPTHDLFGLLREAADEIERLRQRLRDVTSGILVNRRRSIALALAFSAHLSLAVSGTHLPSFEPTVAPDVVALAEHHGAHDPAATVGLYGIFSGFAKARLGVDGVRKSITVGPLPAELATPEWYAVLDRAMDEWNTAAGWWLFHPDYSGAQTDVTFAIDDDRLPNFGAWVEWDLFDTGWYRGCRVLTHSWGPPLRSTIAHELGHCLGFQDVETSDSGYFGIMSYARPATLLPNNEQDIASLIAAGYREG
jgi:hypothetical protein